MSWRESVRLLWVGSPQTLPHFYYGPRLVLRLLFRYPWLLGYDSLEDTNTLFLQSLFY